MRTEGDGSTHVEEAVFEQKGGRRNIPRSPKIFLEIHLFCKEFALKIHSFPQLLFSINTSPT